MLMIINKSGVFLMALLILSVSQPIMASGGCETATDLLFRAYHLYRQNSNIFQQQLLFNRSLQLCPNRPEVHTALASIFERQGKLSQAIYHYQQSVSLKPNFSPAWAQLGKIFYHENQFPISLESYLHACQKDPSSKAQVIESLKNKRYSFTNKDQLTEKESLLVLFNLKRRRNLRKMIEDCDLDELGEISNIEPKHTFFNLTFDINEAFLPPTAQAQLEEIGGALLEVSEKRVIHIHGHSDHKPFRYANPNESEKRNQELSEQRALAVAHAIEEQGIPLTRIKIHSHGNNAPLTTEDSPIALEKNRRIEIEVK